MATISASFLHDELMFWISSSRHQSVVQCPVRGSIHGDFRAPWECTLNVNLQGSRQENDSGLFLLGTFAILLLGRIFSRFGLDVLIHGDIKPTQRHARIV